MAITKSGGRQSGYKKHVSRCMECGEFASILFIRPSDQKSVCVVCEPRSGGVVEDPKRAKASRT